MSTQHLPQTGWLPDPVRAGVLRYRDRGEWTDRIIVRRAPWGPERMLPPSYYQDQAA